jgi:hypothetical protein
MAYQSSAERKHVREVAKLNQTKAKKETYVNTLNTTSTKNKKFMHRTLVKKKISLTSDNSWAQVCGLNQQ